MVPLENGESGFLPEATRYPSTMTPDTLVRLSIRGSVVFIKTVYPVDRAATLCKVFAYDGHTRTRIVARPFAYG